MITPWLLSNGPSDAELDRYATGTISMDHEMNESTRTIKCEGAIPGLAE